MFDTVDIARSLESALPMNQSHSALRDHVQRALATAHDVAPDSWGSNTPWVTDMFPNHVVYSHRGQLQKRSYSVNYGAAGSTPAVTLGKAQAVHAGYITSATKMDEAERSFLVDCAPEDLVSERNIPKADRDAADAADFAGKHRSFPILSPADVKAALLSIGRAGSDNYDAATLKANILRIAKRKGFAIPASDQESVAPQIPEGTELVCEGVTFPDEIPVKEAGTKQIEVKIIGAGWGSMAYYPKEVLQRDGPKVFTKGTHMMWNHATSTEEADRPEGNLDNLAAVLTSDAHWQESGAKGPGLYARAKVFSDYASQVAEKGPHIGVSINAAIRGKEGTREGRTGRIAEHFIRAFSTDFVTRAGAGGAPVVPVTEARRGPTQEQPAMTDEERTQFEATQRENVTLKARLAKVEESQNQILAMGTVAAVLKEAGIPFSQKLLERACSAPTMKEGKPDPEWVKSIVMDFSEGHEGHIQGFGGDEAPSREADKSRKDTDAKLREAFKGLGLPEKSLDYAVAGRA